MEVNTLLCLIAQIHTPEACSIDGGGREVLREKPENVPELKVVAVYGAYTEHTLYYVVQAGDHDTVKKFLSPGFKRCTATITPVSQFFGTSGKDWPVPHQDQRPVPPYLRGGKPWIS